MVMVDVTARKAKATAKANTVVLLFAQNDEIFGDASESKNKCRFLRCAAE
jgi:hypothetical protein